MKEKYQNVPQNKIDKKTTTAHINSIGNYLKSYFGEKIIKLSLDGGFTCPNRDGSKGKGGCIFCSSDGSGDFASDIEGQINLLSKKWPKAKYIAYFQAHTNTYAPVSVLRKQFYAALDYDKEKIVGIAIATRPDCLNNEVLDLLSEINEKTFLWVELGLQTCHDKTAELINRCYPLSVYDEAITSLTERNIRIVTHLILGLPGETKQDMFDSIEYVCKPLKNGKHIFGIKLHLLNVIKGSQMEILYPDYVPFSSLDEYVNIVIDALRIIPWDVTVHRLTADAKRSILISPHWSFMKRTILNNINNTLISLDITQGDMYEIQ